MSSRLFLTVAVAAIALAGCDRESGRESGGNGAPAIAPVAPPEGGDWTQMVSKTPDGGFLMGNPNAKVKLVEFASMTCPHCAEFEEHGVPKLTDSYVKTGNVSYEFRNFIRDPYDLAASLIARCNGEKGFFPLTHAMFEGQQDWIAKLQQVPAEQQQALATMGPEQQFLAIARMADLQTWAAQRGVPTAKSTSCLTNKAEIDQLVQMTSEAVSTHSVPGTPGFLINGELVEGVAGWEALEPKLKDALGG